MATTTITDIKGRQIIDSRGNPTVEVDVTLEGGATGPRGPSPAAPAQANTKRGSCAMVTSRSIAAKACSLRWAT